MTLRFFRHGIMLLALSCAAAHAQFLPVDNGAEAEDKPVLAGQPSLVFPITRHDFGQIYDDHAVKFVYPFTNAGAGELKIISVKPTCGCTVPELKKNTFAPGERSVIEVVFNPRHKKGKKVYHVSIRTNDPVRPEQKISFFADVKPMIVTDPNVIYFGNVPRGQEETRIVKIAGRRQDFQATYASITRAGESSSYMTVEVLGTKPVEIDGESMQQSELKVTLKGSAPIGRIASNTYAAVRTNDPRNPLINLTIRGEVVGDLALAPGRVVLGRVVLGTPITRELRVTSHAGHPFKILGVDQKIRFHAPNTREGVEMDGFDVSIDPLDPAVGTGYVVKISGTIDKPGRIQGKLIIKTDVDEEQTIEAPIYGQILVGKDG